jgi:hypothetical protein
MTGGLLVPRACDIIIENVLVLAVVVEAVLACCKIVCRVVVSVPRAS